MAAGDLQDVPLIVPHDTHIDVDALFWRNVGLKGGPASAATYDREVLLPAVLSPA